MPPESTADIKRKKRRYEENKPKINSEEFREIIEKFTNLQNQIICIIERLEIKMGGAVPFYDIFTYFRKHIDNHKSWESIESLLDGLNKIGLVEKVSNGWNLTEKGRNKFKKEEAKRKELAEYIRKAEKSLENNSFGTAAKLFPKKEFEKEEENE